LFRYASAIIFSTAWQSDIFSEPYRLKLEKCVIVENFYGPRREASYSIVPQNNGIATKVFVGSTRELKWKNLTRLGEAFKRTQESGLNIELRLQTGNREQFLEEVASSYAVVLVSLGDISPNTILEAISFGKPFILTRETGLYEKLKDIGVWVDPENVDDIAAKIEWLADDRNYELQKKKVEAFTFTHSYDEIGKEILDVYRRIVL
jgi:glycosyltransferase involved in cell wall biosynthesis